QFNVIANGVAGGLLITPPAGFEVSNNGTTFGATTTAPGTGTTTIFVRLKANAHVAASPYSGDISVSGTAASATVHLDASTVLTAPLTLSVIANSQSKVYGSTLTGAGPGSTQFTTSGIQNGETVGSVTIAFVP